MTKVTKNIFVIGRSFQSQVFQEASVCHIVTIFIGCESIFTPFYPIQNEIIDIMVQYYYLQHFLW
jgi:hypothetical protein